MVHQSLSLTSMPTTHRCKPQPVESVLQAIRTGTTNDSSTSLPTDVRPLTTVIPNKKPKHTRNPQQRYSGTIKQSVRGGEDRNGLIYSNDPKCPKPKAKSQNPPRVCAHTHTKSAALQKADTSTQNGTDYPVFCTVVKMKMNDEESFHA
jgi:hypothetical protein